MPHTYARGCRVVDVVVRPLIISVRTTWVVITYSRRACR